MPTTPTNNMPEVIYATAPFELKDRGVWQESKTEATGAVQFIRSDKHEEVKEALRNLAFSARTIVDADKSARALLKSRYQINSEVSPAEEALAVALAQVEKALR